MRKYFIIGTALICTFSVNNAYAANVACMASACGDSGYTEIDLTSNCGFKTSTCYGDNKVYSCQSCKSGATRIQKDTGTLFGCGNSAIYYTCSCNCATTAWTESRTGYESRTFCNYDCATETQYRCASGYYGNSTNGTSGCVQCPTWTGVYTDSARTTLARGSTSSAGTTAATGCFVVSGTYYDISGTFTINGNCSYK